MTTGNYKRPKHLLNCKECDVEYYVTHIKNHKGYCKPCAKRISNLEYKRKNKEELKAKNQKYVEANRNKVYEYSKRYREKNSEQLAESKRIYYEENRESILLREERRRRARGEKENGLSGTEEIAFNYLKTLFPSMEIKCRDRSTVKNPKTKMYLELDFYIPDLNLAIELNGVTHYKPIYGEDKFKRQKRNDLIKHLVCRKLGIKLFIVKLEEGVHFDRFDSEHTKLKAKLDEIKSSI